MGVVCAGILTFNPYFANASTVTVIGDNLADNLLVSSGSTISGQFDVGALLVGNKIVSASFSVTATDDYDRTFSYETFGSYVWFRNTPGGSEQFIRPNYRYFTDAAESSVVSFEGITETITASAFYNNPNVNGGNVYENSTYNHCHRSGIFGCITTVNHDYFKGYLDSTSGYKGSLNSSGVLGSSEIGAAMIDGLFNFDVAAATGDFILNSVTLTLETTPVPVPAAAWLFGSGLLGLIGIVRKKM